MAQINQEQSVGTSARPQKVTTHFINIKIVDNSGNLIPLGAIGISDRPNKIERTLLKALENGVDMSKIGLTMDIRKNEPGTDVADINDWLTATTVEVED